ncbi:MAG TPA: putative sporulation protein YtxC [Firmicutes bacterium]|nr:putative sporulation protein YtxC [Bacillota bacterium]
MAEAIRIGAKKYLPAIRETLQKEFHLFRREGLQIEIKEEPRGDQVFLLCFLKEEHKSTLGKEETYDLFRQLVANALAAVIISHWELYLVKEIVHQHYNYFNRQEREKIIELVLQGLEGEQNKGSGHHIYRVHRQNRIFYRLLDYLNDSREIVLEGFIRFRLKEYMEELRDAVDRAVDDLMLEQEYREFIRLLRYFVEVQEPKQGEIHVLMLPGNKYQLMDGQGDALTDKELEEMLVELADGNISSEDLLISALISLAPDRVHLHLGCTFFNREVVETIKKVFADRIDICPGCCLCGQSGTKKEERSKTKPR